MAIKTTNSADREERFGEIVFGYLQAAERGETIDRRRLVTDHPEFAVELEQFLGNLDGVGRLATPLRALVNPAFAGSSFTLHPSSLSSAPLGDFRLIREIGRGGMGIVYEAEQLSLARRVALKVLPFAATMDPRHLQRFRNEAQAAACLHHPNIVPVYGVGCDRGVHYYAMQLIEGQTLAEVMHPSRERERPGSCHSEPPSCHSERSEESTGPREGASRSLASLGMTDRETVPLALLSTRRDRAHFRTIATLIASAADALEYAHSMGVVHRDIKPGNLMLDNGGHLWITDFGLAKSLSRDVHDAALTLTGDLIGTLRYMSPEQALAKHGLVDHRTDIYSLGATLYELLTLKPAVAGNDKAEILKSIAWDEPTPLRKHDKSIPAELETITQKCLAKEPSERYASAGEMAEDLRRWLGDRAIKAKAAGWREKAAKWGRRHRAAIATAILVLILTLVGSVASTLIIANKEREVRLALESESRERARAEASLATAIDAVNQMLTRLGEVRLAHVPQMEATRATILGDALRFTQRLLREQGNDSRLQLQAAELYGLVATTQSQLGHNEDAAAANIERVRILREQRDSIADTTRYRQLLGRALNDLAVDLRRSGQLADAENTFRQAIDFQESLVRDDHSANHRVVLANMHQNLGLLFCDEKKYAESEPLLQRSVSLRQELARESLNNSDRRSDLASALSSLATTLTGLGRYKEAERAFEEATAIQEALVEQYPGNAEYRLKLAFSSSRLGNLLKDQRRFPDAEKAFKKSLTNYQQLAADFPRVPDYRSELLDLQNAFGDVLNRSGRPAEAQKAHLQAIDIGERLMAEWPQKPDFRHVTAGSWHNLALALSALREDDEADRAVRRAMAIEEALVKDYPEIAKYREYLANMFCFRAGRMKNRGQLRDAADALKAAHPHLEMVSRQYPQVPSYRFRVAQNYYALGELAKETNQFDEAVTAFRQALGELEQLHAQWPKETRYSHSIPALLTSLGDVLFRLRRIDEAEREYRRAIEEWTKLARESPNDLNIRRSGSAAVGNLGLNLMRAGRLRDAEPLLRKAAAEDAQLAHDFAKDPANRFELAKSFGNLAILEAAIGRYRDAERGFSDGIDLLESLVKEDGGQTAYKDTLGLWQNDLAWLLVTCTEPAFRDTGRALALAQSAVANLPDFAGSYNTLGMAHYRAGNWRAAIVAVEKSMELAKQRDGSNLFILSMAQWRLGERDKAATTFHEAISWTSKNRPNDHELRSLQTEAAEQIGIADAPKPPPDP